MTDPVQSLDATDEDPNDVENAWAKEIERRRREIREGVVQPVDGDEVMERLRDWRIGDRSNHGLLRRVEPR